MIKALTPQEWRDKNKQWSDGRFETIDEFLLQAEKASRELELVRGCPCLRPNDIALFTVVRNEEVRLPAFLNHYRNLGVDRFFIIDDHSTDETLNVLYDSGDVEIWRAKGQFKEGKLLWLTALIHAVTHAHNNWVVVADADEFLVYDGMEAHDLHDLVQLLEQSCERRLRAVMIDVYGKNSIRNTPWPTGDPLKSEWFYDPDNYKRTKWGVQGGARWRVFSTEEDPFLNALDKYPVGYFDSASGLMNPHQPYPYHLNNGPIRAAMLHLKFTSDFIPLVERAVQEKQFWKGAREYRIYQDALRNNPDLSLYHQGSQRVEGSSSLKDAGLIVPIDWEQPSGHAKAPLRHKLHARIRDLLGPHFRDLSFKRNRS